MKRHALQFMLLAALTSTAARGQITCAPGTPAATRLVCEFPFATGVLANSGAANGDTAVAEARALNLAVATQLSQLPLATASAGTVIAYRNGVPETFNNLGPILVDRAQTIGANRAYFGVTASQYVFTHIDGQQLSNLPFSYSKTGTNGSSTSVYVTENTKASFVVDQLVAVFTYGLSSRAEMSFIIPVTRVSLGARVPASTEYVVNPNGSYFTTPGPLQNASGSATGVGDGEAGFKYALFVGEHSAVSAGSVFRAPTGTAENLLGSGAWGFNPYLVYSFLARVSPHAKIGYQWNTKTELNNPTATPGGNLALPGGLTYDAGADWAISRRFTAAADLLGSQFLNTQRLVTSPRDIPTTPKITITSTTNEPSSYSINDISTGLKWNPGGALVFSVNLLTQINNDGLHARPTPLIGVAYKF